MRAILLMIPAMLLALAGCGGEANPPVAASGKVTVNGQPVEGAMVTFLSAGGGRSASGKTEADGTFKLTTINTNDGAPPGEYTITIAKQEGQGGSQGIDISSGNYGDAYGAMMGAASKNDMSKVLKNALPAKYANATESGLKRTVVKGEENNFVFEL